MNTLQSSADLSWLRETDPVYLTWEWWQWSLAFLEVFSPGSSFEGGEHERAGHDGADSRG